MKKIFVVLAAILLMIISGCSSGVDNAVNSNNIGPAGGTVVSSDKNATLDVPADALSNSTTINIAESTEGNPPGAIASSYDFTPDGLTFNSAVTVSLKYNTELIPKGINETDLQLAYAQNGDWVPLINSTVDTTNHIISAPTNHFTIYTTTCGSPDTYDADEGDLNGVKVYSNGKPTNNFGDKNNDPGTYTGLKWQCVEFVNRYYWQIYGVDINQEQFRTNANGYYTKAIQKGLVPYENGGSVPPQSGDLIVSEGTSGNVGHVAIIKEIHSDYILVTQQNYCENVGDLNFILFRSGNYISSFGVDKRYPTTGWNGGSYPIKGWLRLPSVSGKVTLNGTGLSGVTVTLVGAISTQTLTDENGNYSFVGVANGPYTIYSSKSGGYRFTPTSQSITVNNVDLANLTVNKGILTIQDIIATAYSAPSYVKTLPYTVAGNTYSDVWCSTFYMAYYSQNVSDCIYYNPEGTRLQSWENPYVDDLVNLGYDGNVYLERFDSSGTYIGTTGTMNSQGYYSQYGTDWATQSVYYYNSDTIVRPAD